MTSVMPPAPTHQTAAVAIFVKTPGISPIKTRLAADIGPAAAERFYRACLASMSRTLAAAQSRGISPYWAIAEPEGMRDPLWSAFPVIFQGEGELGDRLDQVYQTFGERHSCVMLAGADVPDLTLARLVAAVESVRSTPFALAGSGDGGYALFAGTVPIPRAVWTAVPYSSPATAAEFLRLLEPLGQVTELEPLDDVDTLADLICFIHHERVEPEEETVPAEASPLQVAREIARNLGVARYWKVGSEGGETRADSSPPS